MPLDIAFGIFTGLGAAEFFNADLSTNLILFSVASALLPDIDILLASRMIGEQSWLRKYLGGHRGLLHNPAIYILPAMFVYVIAGGFWTTIFSVGILWHFVHDTFFLGWGIAWLWPFSHRRIKFFPDRNGCITSLPILTWMPKDDQKIRAEWGTKHWIRDFYFRPSLISVVEFGGLIFTLVLLVLYAK